MSLLNTYETEISDNDYEVSQTQTVKHWKATGTEENNDLWKQTATIAVVSGGSR